MLSEMATGMSKLDQINLLRELWVTPEQMALLRAWQDDPYYPGWTQAMAFRVSGIKNEDRLIHAIRRFVQKNGLFCRRFRCDVHGKWQRFAAPNEFDDVDVVAALECDDHEVESELSWIIATEGEYGFDLGEDFPVRARVIRIGEDSWGVALVFHRLVYHRCVKRKYLAALKAELSRCVQGPGSGGGIDSVPEDSFLSYLQQRYHNAVVYQSVPVVREQSGILSPLAWGATTMVGWQSGREAVSVAEMVGAEWRSISRWADSHKVSTAGTLLTAVLLWCHVFRRLEKVAVQADLSSDIPSCLPGEEVRQWARDPGGSEPRCWTDRLAAEHVIAPLSRVATLESSCSSERLVATITKELDHQFGISIESAPCSEMTGGGQQAGKASIPVVLCRFYDLDDPGLSTHDFEIVWSDADIVSTEYDLEVIFEKKEGSLKLITVGHQGLSHTIVKEWGRELQSVIEKIVEGFDPLVSDVTRALASGRIALLEARSRLGESRSVIPGSRATETDSPSLAHAFSSVAARNPDKAAIRGAEEKITYGELEELSSCLGRDLLARAGAGGRIGILVDQGISAIIAILGVLKSGNAYVPLDTNIPEARILVMIDDAELSLLVYGGVGSWVHGKAEANRPPLLCLEEWACGRGGADAVENNAIHPSVLMPCSEEAYILYTSGSTGAPKGVLQTQKNVLFYVDSYARLLDVGETDVLTLISAYSVDAAVVDIFTALLHGATLVIYDLKKESFANIARRLGKEGVTVFHSTASVFRYFSDSLTDGKGFDRIRYVVLGGEQVKSRDLLRMKKGFCDGATLVNLYGASEITICSMAFYEGDDRRGDEILPVGTPLDMMSVFVVDENGAPTPGAGELVVASPHLAMQYWNQPTLTDKKFKVDFVPEGRVFFTGDVGEVTAGGELRHLGRTDFQIKIRGYRVEPGEIEAQILKYEHVSECVVHPVPSQDGELHLAAFVVTSVGCTGFSIDELRRFLKRWLPDYMIPDRFLHVDWLPRTASGKVNAKELEAMLMGC